MIGLEKETEGKQKHLKQLQNGRYLSFPFETTLGTGKDKGTEGTGMKNLIIRIVKRPSFFIQAVNLNTFKPSASTRDFLTSSLYYLMDLKSVFTTFLYLYKQYYLYWRTSSSKCFWR